MGNILMPMLHLQARMNLLFATGPALFDVDFKLTTGSLTGLCGPSGSGKTTLLRILAGLTMPESGLIRVGDRIWLDTAERIQLPVQQRKVGMVFQDAALFPNMTVRQNVEFAAENRRDSLVDELLSLVNLVNLADRKPATLSGGQRQRVALIRALARRPDVLLLDEPFSALDYETRQQLLNELVRLHRQFGTTTVLVSHHQDEIQRVADRILELNQGKVTDIGSPSVAGKITPVPIMGTIQEVQVEETTTQLRIRLTDNLVVLNVPSGTQQWQIGETIVVDINPQTLTRRAD
ncbi:sulfate/molybdate ABC transporter ATP-binding protein [Larkinella sp. GY13]|uniref:sulfate/molybdate ABC transporter ATP-binding protein n=1 Tax=Larkinella sp. GY13 TaxID=3453720 RepID=UPI003F6FE775